MSSNAGPQEKPDIVGNRGLFITERISPGTYEICAEGYAPLTPEQERSTGMLGGGADGPIDRHGSGVRRGPLSEARAQKACPIGESLREFQLGHWRQAFAP